MDEVAFTLNRIADSLTDSGTPMWLTAIGILMPILLAAITIFMSVRTDRQNRELQKLIHNRDVANQTRQIIIEIYHAFFNAFVITQHEITNVAGVFTSEQLFLQWENTIDYTLKEVSFAYNKLKLLLPEDREIVEYTRKCWVAFTDINYAVSTYIRTGIAAQTIRAAWSTIQTKCIIQFGDYFTLYQNTMLAEEFTRLCENTYTRDIQRKLEVYSELIGKNEFDDLFKKYVQIRELE